MIARYATYIYPTVNSRSSMLSFPDSCTELISHFCTTDCNQCFYSSVYLGAPPKSSSNIKNMPLNKPLFRHRYEWKKEMRGQPLRTCMYMDIYIQYRKRQIKVVTDSIFCCNNSIYEFLFLKFDMKTRSRNRLAFPVGFFSIICCPPLF